MAMGVGALALSVSGSSRTQRPESVEFANWVIPDDWKNQAIEDIENGNAVLDLVLGLLVNNPDVVDLQWVETAFRCTYLKEPRLYVGSGKPLEGWKEVLPELRKLATKYRSFARRNTKVKPDYLFYDRAGRPASEYDKDFKLTIRFDLEFGPDNDPPMEGDLFHRRICEIDP